MVDNCSFNHRRPLTQHVFELCCNLTRKTLGNICVGRHVDSILEGAVRGGRDRTVKVTCTHCLSSYQPTRVARDHLVITQASERNLEWAAIERVGECSVGNLLNTEVRYAELVYF